jgi:type IV pilus assembly protein PilV
MSLRNSRSAHTGFSLVETMVALLVISIGLLGIAKMQALALASTGTARMRSIAALEAASIATMMHANRGYWSSFVTPPTGTPVVATITIPGTSGRTFDTTGTTVTMPTSGDCNYPHTCTESQLAAVDLTSWTTALQTTMPSNATASIVCSGSTSTPAPGTPVACTVQINWTENLVELDTGMNASLNATQKLNALQAGAATHFILYVDP